MKSELDPIKPPESRQGARYGVPRILVVDDDTTTTRTIEGILKRAGFDTVCAFDMAGALAAHHRHCPDLVLLDVSLPDGTGFEVCRRIPADMGVPVLIVQHMPAIFTHSLAESLAKKCSIRVKEAADGELIASNTAYIAPGGRQMGLVAGPGDQKMIRITDDPPENNCRPSVDYLFRSTANHFPGRALAVILTGMGSDGVIGLKRLKRQGCNVLAQDEASCVVFGMPKAAIDAGVTDRVLSLDDIAAEIGKIVRNTNL